MRISYCVLTRETGHEAAYRLLEESYRRETGEAMPPVLRTPRDKPYFENSPWHFSLSHTKRHAFCVLARENVAIDAEELDRKVGPGLPEKILSPEEKRQYDAAADKQRAFLTFWVLKEAAVKLSGEGLQGIRRETAFSLDDPRVQEIDGCIVAVITN